ncbi:MFS transporter [Paenibacillus sp. CGMCC 1.16610]|uniref:MFS transporter n=1 Tax=Paenibacillus anseongense TaxID=2682845 RepID=A0ABW9U5P1_9BACL|nr:MULTISPECIES: MFS transporter [Paenibacillus]MBA2942603.1 MFS transporter [Paenibacillus sp. CGMCC 1.16610]MVQ35417.1 MFS transporter [Paenibacillus anseongense]
MSNTAKSNKTGHLWLITAVALGTLLNPLNTTMISVAFSRLQEEFHVTYASISWLIATYYVASAVAQPVMGKVGDLFGRKKIFMLGLALITVSSMLAPLSTSFGWLMTFRVIQAIGSSALFPNGMGIIRSVITTNQARALSVMSVFSSTSAALGPSLGGFLIQYSDWPSIFLINFPFIVVSFVLSLRMMPKDAPRKQSGAGSLDITGIVFFTALIFSWLFFFLSFKSGVNWLLLLLSLVLSVGFYWYEAKRKQPFIDVLFLKRNVDVCFVYLQFILVNIVFYSIMFGIPSYLQQVRHYNGQEVGLIMLSISGFGILVTPLVGRWIDRSGSRTPLLVGTLFVVAGTSMLLTIHDSSTAVWIFICLSVLGISNGFQNLGLQTALYSYVTTAETGIASGMFMTSRFMGTILSSSLLGTVFSTQITTAHFHSLIIGCVIISVLMLLLSLRMFLRARSGTEQVQSQ